MNVCQQLFHVRSCLSENLTKCNNSFCFQYIVWVQSVKPDRLHTLAKSLDSAIRQLTKCDLQLELVELEFAAKMVDEEQKSPQQKSAKSSRDVTATQDSDDSDSEDSSSDSDSSNSCSTTSSDDEESAESLSDVIKPKKQLCHVIKPKNVTTDSDDTSDEETSPKRKVESQIENLEKDFNAIGIESEEQSLLINSISSSETDATHKQNQLIIENNPPPNGHAATEVKCKVSEPETVKVQQLEAEVKETGCVTVKQLEAEVKETDCVTVKQLEAEAQKTDDEKVKQLEAEVQKTDAEKVKAEETDAEKVEHVEAEMLAQSLEKVTIE